MHNETERSTTHRQNPATRMTGAELAAWRHLLGLSQAEIGEVLGNRRDTVKDWELGTAPIPYGVRAQIDDLVVEHDRLVAAYVTAGAAIEITRTRNTSHPHPRGWRVAAAARALEIDPDLMVKWIRT